MVAPAISRAETHQCRDGAMPWSGHGSGNIRLSRTSRRRTGGSGHTSIRLVSRIIPLDRRILYREPIGRW